MRNELRALGGKKMMVERNRRLREGIIRQKMRKGSVASSEKRMESDRKNGSAGEKNSREKNM